MKITRAEFVTGAVSSRQYPSQPYPEVAFIGRSNVGKSSLINSLLNRKKLVKTSSTPGKTQMINFFAINESVMFADLPGYGFAKVPQSVKKKWQKMIEGYLQERTTLCTVILILDIRRKPTDLDLQMQEWLETMGIDYILVATKADKLSQAEQSKQAKLIRKAFVGDVEGVDLFVYSSQTHRGKKDLWKALRIKLKEGAHPSEE